MLSIPMTIIPKEGMYHVSQLNWSDSTIHRASITPIFMKKNVKLIGLGVTNSTSVIVTIGGAFEANDGDLLATAVREYNEETGSSLKEQDILGCYALRNKGSINILLPVPDRINFKANKELERILWLTTIQAATISLNQSYTNSGMIGKARILTMSQALINEIPLLIRAVNSNVPFTHLISPFFFPRTYKTPEIKQTRVTPNFNQLRIDILDPSLFYGSASLTARGNYVSLERRDKTVYALSSVDFNGLINIIRDNKIKIYVGFETDVEMFSELLGRQHLASIEERIKKFSKDEVNKESLQRIWNDFTDKIKLIRSYPDIYSVTWEAILIHETEEAIYRVTQSTPFSNNRMRTSFFEALDLTNMYILDKTSYEFDIMLWQLEEFLISYQEHQSIKPRDALDIMIELQLLKRDNYNFIDIA